MTERKTMEFTYITLATRNFTPSELMRDYAEDTPAATFVRDRYLTSYICKNGVWYEYDHMKIEPYPDEPDLITVTVYLKEKTI